MDLIEALRLSVEWGADEALLEAPQDRRGQVAAPPPAPVAPRKVARAAAALPAGPADSERITARCETLEALEQALAAFTGCALRDTATQTGFADGAADAEVML